VKGIVLVDKPEGWTSFDVVARVRGMVARIEGKKPRNVKVGHTGTLDPAATGLLVLCVGKEFTKKVPTMIKHDKTYEVELTLGQTSTTGDKEGDLENVSKERPTERDVVSAISSFQGDSMQMPPKFSALKINGKRAYELARKGKEVILQPRKITIHSIDAIEYDYPKVTFLTSVGSGTYIRSLAEDIGEKLKTGAYMSNLRRTVVGDRNVTQAVAISDLTDEILENTLVE
jgi:tRNA pseudouridine55 synthase